MADKEHKVEFADMPVRAATDVWRAANREALLEMAAWDRDNEIFASDQRLF